MRPSMYACVNLRQVLSGDRSVEKLSSVWCGCSEQTKRILRIDSQRLQVARRARAARPGPARPARKYECTDSISGVHLRYGKADEPPPSTRFVWTSSKDKGTTMKRLILCCDGTWNSADQAHDGVPCPTNVVKLGFRVAKRCKADNVPQIVHYDEGVGTGNSLDRLSGGALGRGLEENIHEAYRFLVANYEPGDELFLFGFSRGAFTARSIAGMIRKCGILGRGSISHYCDALALYRDADRPDTDEPKQFRRTHCVCEGEDIKIKFIGVWDTVGSLGIPLRGLRWLTRKNYQFHDTELSGVVQHAYHALAIDERRAPFEPTLWQYRPKPEQTVEQVWFCGAHSDVGGGYPDSDLSDVALDWMIEKSQAAGLEFDEIAERAYPLSPDSNGPLHESKTGLYRLTRGFDRPIGLSLREGADRGASDPTQSVHRSVLERWDGNPDYRPPALLEYFRRTGDPRAQQDAESALISATPP